MNKKRWIIGVDFGATFVKMARLSLAGKIDIKSVFSTRDFRAKESLITEMIRRIRTILPQDKDSLLGIGIGVPGQVDYKKGLIYNLTNVDGFKDVALKKIVEKEFRLPVYVDNDTNVACLGEMEWGAAKGYSNVICVTLGSGVGGGLAIDGKLYRGGDFSAGEIGHICIDKNGPQCNCGSNGCLETFVGADYIVKVVIRRLKNGEESIILKLSGNNFSKITPRIIGSAANKGDRLAISIWKQVGKDIGIGLSGITNLLNPQIIVIGGGISRVGKVLFDAIRETVRRRSLNVAFRRLRITRARFIDSAGIIGAAALVKIEIISK